MEMNRGMKMMVESLIKMLGLDPVKMFAAVEDIRKSVYLASVEMQTIRRQNDLIMAALNLPPIGEPNDDRHVQQPVQHPAAHTLNGSGAGSTPAALSDA